MLKSIYIALTLWICTTVVVAQSPIKNQKTAWVPIDGHGVHSKHAIEKVAYKKGLSTAAWDAQTQTAQLTYDSLKTHSKTLLKQIALAGYDNALYLAPGATYNRLTEDSRYTRNRKPQTASNTTLLIPHHTTDTAAQSARLISSYMEVKNALVQSNLNASKSELKLLINAINHIEINTLKNIEITNWQSHIQTIKQLSEKADRANNIDLLRHDFDLLSKALKNLLAEMPMEKPIYYMFCPMFSDATGGNWLSETSAIQNPFYGRQMLNCGNFVQTLK